MTPEQLVLDLEETPPAIFRDYSQQQTLERIYRALQTLRTYVAELTAQTQAQRVGVPVFISSTQPETTETVYLWIQPTEEGPVFWIEDGT